MNALQTSDSTIQLRFATEADTGLIFAFIQALADYERLAHAVVTDEAGLRKSLFQGRKVAEVVIAEYENQPAGFALFFHTYSTFLGKPGLYLEDLFVQPELRGRGIGRALLTCLARIAVERDCGRLEWSVLDWNEPAIGFYQQLGAQPLEEWTMYRMTGPALTQLADTYK